MLCRPSVDVSSSANVILVQEITVENVNVVHGVLLRLVRKDKKAGMADRTSLLVDAAGIEPATSAL